MKKILLSLFLIVSVGMLSPQLAAKDAKLMAGWTKTLLYTVGDESTVYQSSVNDEKGMLVTTATYNTDNQITALTYKYYDKKDKEKFSGSFSDMITSLTAGEDAYVQCIYKKHVVIRIYAGNFGAYTKDVIYTYKIKKDKAKLIGGPIDLPLNQTVKMYIVKNKVLISVIIKDGDGNQTDNYVMIYDNKLGQFTKIQGTTRSNIMANTQKIVLPKYWEVDDISYNGDYSETYKTIKIYK
jgi:hypothetical protein